MLNNTIEWSHTRGNAVAPSRWQAATPKAPGKIECTTRAHNPT